MHAPCGQTPPQTLAPLVCSALQHSQSAALGDSHLGAGAAPDFSFAAFGPQSMAVVDENDDRFVLTRICNLHVKNLT